MRKFLLRYLIFWLPAAAAAYFFNNASDLSQILQWFFSFFMVFGWSVNTGMAAYHFPRSTLSALLTYTGFHILIIITMYTAYSGSGLSILLRKAGGLFSYNALDIMVQALRPFPELDWEMVVTLFLACCCAVGFLIGLLHRRINPDPYSPRIRKARG